MFVCFNREKAQGAVTGKTLRFRTSPSFCSPTVTIAIFRVPVKTLSIFLVVRYVERIHVKLTLMLNQSQNSLDNDAAWEKCTRQLNQYVAKIIFILVPRVCI